MWRRYCIIVYVFMYVQDCTGISHVYVSCEIQCQVDVYVCIYIYTWKITKIGPYKDGLVPVLPVRPPKKRVIWDPCNKHYIYMYINIYAYIYINHIYICTIYIYLYIYTIYIYMYNIYILYS